MASRLRLVDLFEGKRHQKIVLTVSVFIFLILELVIYLAAAGQAGVKSRVAVKDANGTVVYQTSGTALTSYEKMVFENNYGSLRNYGVHLESENMPFPFRAWLTAAVGIPVGLILLVAFLVRAYLSLLFGDERSKDEGKDTDSAAKGRLGILYNSFQSISVFHIGFAVVVGVLLLWMVPNFLGDFATVMAAAIRDYKWFFLGVTIFLAGLIIWIIFLRYRLSRQMLENQLHLEKYRVDKQLLLDRESPQLLTSAVKEAPEQ